jgi:hypothetical protein
MSYGKLQWTPVRIRAIQGHRNFLVQEGGMASMIRTMYTFDMDFDVSKVGDPMVHPCFSAMPEGSPIWEDFPRVIYHTCDQAAFLSIICNGLVPGGVPHKTGRAHNFNSTPPWKAEMKKLQGTRAGRPMAIAFDTELLMQFGTKLFATDEAILSPDWVSNVALMNACDMRSGEFFFVNRAYATHREAYQAVLKEAKEHFYPTDDLLSKMTMYLSSDAELNFEGIKQRIEFGKLLPFSRKDWKSAGLWLHHRQSGGNDKYSTDACGFQRHGRHGKGGGNWGKGHGRWGFELQMKDISVTQI